MIGHGSGKAGSHGVHGSPLGAADLKAVKAKFGFNPEEVRACVLQVPCYHFMSSCMAILS